MSTLFSCTVAVSSPLRAGRSPCARVGMAQRGVGNTMRRGPRVADAQYAVDPVVLRERAGSRRWENNDVGAVAFGLDREAIPGLGDAIQRRGGDHMQWGK